MCCSTSSRGLGYEASVKAVLALSMLGSGLAMYGFVRSWLGRRAGLVAAVAYMAIPYHLVNVFVRAAMAESVALALLPLALWGFREAVVRPRLARRSSARGVAFAAIMWTSNLVALVFTPALAAYVAALILLEARAAAGLRLSRPQSLRTLWPATLRRSWPPASPSRWGWGSARRSLSPRCSRWAYINRTQWFGEYYNPEQHFVYFNQLFDPRWGFGISQPGPDDAAQGSLSYQLGAAATLLTLIALAVSGRFRPRIRVRSCASGACGCWSQCSSCCRPRSSLWRYIPIVGFAQFPWRYLMLAILPLSILPAALVARREAWTGALGACPCSRLAVPFARVRAQRLLLLSSAPYLRSRSASPPPSRGPSRWPR